MSKLTKSARGHECQVRIPEVCNFDNTTVVLAHLNGAGMGMKHHDIHGAYACSACHTVVDNPTHYNAFSPSDIRLWHFDGVVRTQTMMLEAGLIKI